MKFFTFDKVSSLRKRKKIEVWIMCIMVVSLLIVLYQIALGSNATQQTFQTDHHLTGANIEFLSSMGILGNSSIFKGEKLIHLDLKGAPPRISYLKKIFPYFKGMGATGLLIEYEDMFPFSEALDKADNAYSQKEIKEILQHAQTNELKVIPLIQTFGHLEFLLKREKFIKYREVERYPQVICPSYENTTTLIRRMIDEVLQVHKEAKYIHIGCDEVYYIGKCDKCKALKTKYGWTDHNLLLNHIQTVAKYITDKHKGVRPIIWGDMIQHVGEDLIRKYNIHNLVDIMVWHYTPNIAFTRSFFMTCAKLFKSIWIAGAFKGATGADQIVTNTMYHIKNLQSWMRVVAEWKGMINFKGIALTGWQRYDHFAVLCELLPISIPSIIFELQYLRDSIGEVDNRIILSILQCNGPLIYDPDEYEFKITTVCNFPGFRAYREITNFFILRKQINKNNPFHSANGWFSTYNIIHKYSSPSQVENFLANFPVDAYKLEVEKAAVRLKEHLMEVYDDHTIQEWLLTYVTPLKLRLESISRSKNAVLDKRSWPRRPLKTSVVSPWTSADSMCRENELCCGLMTI